MNPIFFLLPLVFMPFLVSWIIPKTNAKRKLTYLIIAIFVPIYPLLLVKLNILPENGVVLAGTSVFMIPAVLFLQYLANKFIFKN
jgi:uncharacterized membrane protein